MRKLVASLSILMFASLLGALEYVSLDEAYKMQQANNKPIMIVYVKDGCRYCDRMDKLFEDRELSRWIEDRFIAVKHNTKNSLPFCDVNMTPSYCFLDKNQEVLKLIPGSWSKEDFMDLSKDIGGR